MSEYQLAGILTLISHCRSRCSYPTNPDTPVKPGGSVYLDMITGFAVEIFISAFTTEETMGYKTTRTSIDHILFRFDDLIVVPGVIREKLADCYISDVVILSEGRNDVEQVSVENLIIDNKTFNLIIKKC